MIFSDAYLLFGMLRQELISLSYSDVVSVASAMVFSHVLSLCAWSQMEMRRCCVCSRKVMVRSSMKAVATIFEKTSMWSRGCGVRCPIGGRAI